MRLLSAHRHLNAEFDWLATDIDGSVGFFSTGGAGPIPDLREQDSPPDLSGVLLRLPLSCDAEYVSELPGEHSEWIELARRSLSAFDWSRRLHRYVLVARPIGRRELPNIAQVYCDHTFCKAATRDASSDDVATV
jgi:hypothetical protein